MTIEQAKHTFGRLMKKAREGKLTEADKRELTIARQTIRASRKSFGMPMRNKKIQRRKNKFDWVFRYPNGELSKRFRTYMGAYRAAQKAHNYAEFDISIIQKVEPRSSNPRVNRSFKHVRLRSSKGLHHFRTVKVGKHRIVIGCPVAHPKGGRCPVATIATSILHPKTETRSNPTRKKLLRMGKLVELRYHRDHGKSRGYYRHQFSSKPTLYFDPTRNQIFAG